MTKGKQKRVKNVEPEALMGTPSTQLSLEMLCLSSATHLWCSCALVPLWGCVHSEPELQTLLYDLSC